MPNGNRLLLALIVAVGCSNGAWGQASSRPAKPPEDVAEAAAELIFEKQIEAAIKDDPAKLDAWAKGLLELAPTLPEVKEEAA